MLNTIRSYLKQNNIDAWVIYDFAATNPAYLRLIGNTFSTRKSFLIVSTVDAPMLICHIIDLPGIQKKLRTYTVHLQAVSHLARDVRFIGQ